MRRTDPRRGDPRRPGWSRTARRSPLRGLLALCLLTASVGGLFVTAPPAPVRADDLADAIAKQKALEAQIAQQKAQVAKLTKQQAALGTEIVGTKQALGQVNVDLAAAQGQVVQMTVAAAQAQAQVDELDATVAQLQLQLTDLEEQEAAKAAELNDRKALLAERIRLAYDTDRTSLLETMLSSDTFTDALSEVAYQLDFADQDKALAEEVMADQRTLAVLHASVQASRDQAASLRAAADGHRAELDQQLSDLADARARLASLQAETKRLLDQQTAAYKKLIKTKTSLNGAIENGEAAEAALQKEIDRLVQEQSRGGAIPSVYNGTLAWPMAGTITQEFGCTGVIWEPRKGSCAHYHNGIDIAAPMYTPIRAAGPGVVLFAGPNPYDPNPKAWIVIIAHAENLVSWYAHVDNGPHPITVKAGQHVVAGQVIAYEGMTGRTTGPHLHWMVELNGNFVNPRLFL